MSRQRAPRLPAPCSVGFKSKASSSSLPRTRLSSCLLQASCRLMNGYIVGWNSHGRRVSADLKTEAGGGQERVRMSSDGWTWRENASARQVHPVSASFVTSRRILFLNNLCACSCLHSILNTRVKMQVTSMCARQKSIRSTPASSQSCRCQRQVCYEPSLPNPSSEPMNPGLTPLEAGGA